MNYIEFLKDLHKTNVNLINFKLMQALKLKLDDSITHYILPQMLTRFVENFTISTVGIV